MNKINQLGNEFIRIFRKKKRKFEKEQERCLEIIEQTQFETEKNELETLLNIKLK